MLSPNEPWSLVAGAACARRDRAAARRPLSADCLQGPCR